MSTLLEIEQAARQLPPAEQAILVERLQGNVQTAPQSPMTRSAHGRAAEWVQWPDVEARARSIFGDQVIPNMVLEERESADR